jgi:hypothetical protein
MTLEDKCCICGDIINGNGNNALPIEKGMCCDECMYSIVIPIRMKMSRRQISKKDDSFKNEVKELKNYYIKK